MLIIALITVYPLIAVAEDNIELDERVTEVAKVVQTVQYEEPIGPEPEKPETKVSPFVSKPQPTLKQICSCESGNGKYGTPQQFETDGVTPLVGRLTPARLGQDIGMCQINTMYHLETATSLGYDIYTEEGNWGYATYLYETQGTQPWNASKPCWAGS
jgi:hypothetical protein